MFGQPTAPAAKVFPAATPGPLSTHFRALAARTLAGRGGRPAAPAAPMAGAPIPPPQAHMTVAPHQRMPKPGQAV